MYKGRCACRRTEMKASEVTGEEEKPKTEAPDEEPTKPKTQGTIWTQYQLPFAVFVMPGVVSGPIARATMSATDMELLLEGMWKGTLARQARGRGLQQPLLLLHVEYKDEFFRIGYLEEGLKLVPGRDKDGRDKWLGGAPPTGLGDVTLDVTNLAETLGANSSLIARARIWIDPRLRLVGELPAIKLRVAGRGRGGGMSLVIVFEVRSELAHFRRPDTLATHATYPFPTRTALRGLIAAVLGEDRWSDNAHVGLRLLGPVRTVAQQLSLHGKTWEAGSGARGVFPPSDIHRAGNTSALPRLHGRPPRRPAGRDAARRKSHFHTYLGSAFCLTFPRWVAAYDSPPVQPTGQIECASIVPAPAVGRLVLDAGRGCARVGGVLLEHLGPFADRRFRGSTAVLYEPAGGSVVFEPAPRSEGAFWVFNDLPGEGMVCLW